ncbi:MAG: Rsd/AlgQ family anti-sigma factor [Pseudomonadales bacterium]
MRYLTEQAREQATAATAAFFEQADESFTQTRQRLISYLIKLNHALNEDLVDLSQALLSRFCDSLVDYLSAGHFRVFQRLALLPREYAAIEATTEAAMSFNDRFGNVRDVDLAALKSGLERIARVLSTRFELEDELLLGDEA